MEQSENIRGKVMIIEDEIDLCYLLSLVLKKINLQTCCVYSINEAKENIRKIKPSVVFLDNNLPDGYGADFIPIVKKIFPAATIIMITAFDSPQERDFALNRGADYFISKPFTSQKIRATIDRIEANRA